MHILHESTIVFPGLFWDITLSAVYTSSFKPQKIGEKKKGGGDYYYFFFVMKSP